MNKPNGFETVAASLSIDPLELGGHVCVIKGVEEAKSKTGKDMLKVALDIGGDDPQAGYYAERFKNDTRENKKWPCISYVVTTDNTGNCSRGLAQFVTSVEESNPGFKFPWDSLNLLKGKRIFHSFSCRICSLGRPVAFGVRLQTFRQQRFDILSYLPCWQ